MTHCLCKHDRQGYNLFNTLPDQQLHIASTNMTASNVISFYDTLPDQWLHIALASMIVGDVIFFTILCWTNDRIASAKITKILMICHNELH